MDVLIDNESVEPRIIEDADNTYLYFTYNHSARTVQIMGTHVIPEFPSAIIMPLFKIISILAVILTKRSLLKNLRIKLSLFSACSLQNR